MSRALMGRNFLSDCFIQTSKKSVSFSCILQFFINKNVGEKRFKTRFCLKIKRKTSFYANVVAFDNDGHK